MKTHHLLKVPLLASALNNYAPVYAQGGEDGVAETICGPNDDRVRSFDVRQGRLQPSGCTAWLISENVFLTAGHCAADQAGQDPLVHFTSGAEDAPLEDQYAVDLSSYKSVLVPTEEGLIDWAAGRLHRNPLTGKWPGVAQTQKCGAQGCGWYSLGPVPSQVSENDITIIGYGEIEGRVFPQTIHTGPLVNINKYELHYRTDSTGGNSGGPVLHFQTGNAIGIHSSGGCTETGGRNVGTRIDAPGLMEYISVLINTSSPTGKPTISKPPTTAKPTSKRLTRGPTDKPTPTM